MSKFGEVPKLNLKQKVTLTLNGAVFVKYMKPEGYRDFVPVYVVRCGQHGLFLDNPHGYHGLFDCDLCLEEDFKKCHV
jgi:hypothetical protein